MGYGGLIERLQHEHDEALERLAVNVAEIEEGRVKFAKACVLIGQVECYLETTLDPEEDTAARKRLRELTSGFRRATGSIPDPKP